jgi:acetyl-CoA carboxylase biotin carboxylase subunit
MIKAAAGGGGRGIRVARSKQEFERLMPQARAEAQAAFGDGGLYIEKLVENARHIEVQVLGDGETSSIASSANARCSGAGRKCGKKRPRRRSPPNARAAVRLGGGAARNR